MKKILYLFLTLFIGITCVRAEEANISYQRLDGIYYNLNINGNLDSNHVTSFHLNGRIAYCIEPGVAITTRVYDINTNWDNTTLSEQTKDYIQKVGYYGFEYPNHQTSYYYIAAQELIWKAINPSMEVVWSTGVNKTGDIINIEKEKAEIEKLVKDHSVFPSFAFKEFSDYLGREIIIEDQNNVLDSYDMSESKYHQITKEGNKLKIKLNQIKQEDETITLTRKHYDNEPLLIYSKGDSQKLAALRIQVDNTAYFKISNKEFEEEIIDVPDTGINIKHNMNWKVMFNGFNLN